MKRSLVAVLLLATLGCEGQISVDTDLWPDPDFEKYRRFVIELDRFNRKLGGCPASGLDMAGCNPQLGSFDVALWRKMRKDAQEVFQMNQ